MNAMVVSASTSSFQPASAYVANAAYPRPPWQAPAHAAPAKLCLTRRGRLVLFGVPTLIAASALVFIALAIVFGSLASPAHASAEHVPVDMGSYARSVTVLQGDSLWSIAGAADPHRDVREVVAEIVVLNDLGTGVVHAGQRLFVPMPK